MGRGRKPIPTAIKERTGALAKNPQRRNTQEPKASSKHPAVPETFTGIPAAKKKWQQLCQWLEQMEMLSETDTDLMEAYCLNYSRLIDSMNQSKDSLVLQGVGGPIRNPMSLEFHKCADRQLKMLTEMGLTPSSRSSLKTGKKEDSDPFGDFLAASIKASRN